MLKEIQSDSFTDRKICYLLEQLQKEDFTNYNKVGSVLQWWDFMNKMKISEQVIRSLTFSVPETTQECL